MRFALCVVFLCVLSLAGGLFSVAGLGLLSQEAEPVSEDETETTERVLIFDGAASEDAGPVAAEDAGSDDDGGSDDDDGTDDDGTDGLFGPGDGEPAVNFKFRLLGDDLDVGVLSVHLNDQHLYTVGLGRADLIAPVGDSDGGLEIKITQSQLEDVLERELTDPDLPPVTVTCVLYNRLTMGLLDVVTWTGYLQGCWLEFPELASLTAAAGDEPPEPFLDPKVDISSTLGRTTAVDMRLEKTTIYYMLFASEDRDAVLLHPEDPAIYSRARVVSGGTFCWKDKAALLDISPKKKHFERLKYTPNSDRMYMVLWTLHRALEPVDDEEPTGDGEVNPRVDGWTRSTVYELTNGLPEPEQGE